MFDFFWLTVRRYLVPDLLLPRERLSGLQKSSRDQNAADKNLNDLRRYGKVLRGKMMGDPEYQESNKCSRCYPERIGDKFAECLVGKNVLLCQVGSPKEPKGEGNEIEAAEQHTEDEEARRGGAHHGMHHVHACRV